MFKEKWEKAKALIQREEDKPNKKKIENLVVFLILIVITVIAINVIWNGDTKKEESTKGGAPENTNKELATEGVIQEETNTSRTEGKLGGDFRKNTRSPET